MMEYAFLFVEFVGLEENHIERRKNFGVSAKWMRKFRKRHHFSQRKGHLKRRPKATEEEIQTFKEKVQHVLQIAEGDHVINADESPWHFDEKSLTTWAQTGSENVIIEGNQKPCFTFIGAINANNQLLPPVFLSAGKTALTERNWFGEAHSINSWDERKQWNYITDHTKSGWTNRQSWIRFLLFLRKYIPINPEKTKEQNTIYLICDSYRSHIPNPKKPNDPLKAFLEDNNIEIIKVPEGTTERCQPLDCRIFGAIKSHAKKAITNKEIDHLMPFLINKDHRYHIQETYTKLVLTKPQVKVLLVQCYYQATPTLIQEAWNKAIYE